MKTIKVIDLLNKIANGEEVPKKIRFNNIEWNIVYGEKNVCYIDEYDSDFFIYIFRNNLDFTLNDEIEIIEEKKLPEKITMRAGLVGDINNKIENLDINIMTVEDKINEIIDYLESKGDE